MRPRTGAPRPAYDDLATGTMIAGKFRIVGRLGSGGMGVVYEALDTALRRHVALKIPRADKLSSAVSARLFREARVASALTPDRTARVFEIGRLDDGTPFLVLEKLEGENLSERLRRTGRVEVTEAVDLVAEACVGLQEAHRQGVIHRDLKPSNLFIAKKPDGTSAVRVLDFGVAALLHDEPGLATDLTLTQTGSTLGSPAYMAPEQIRAARDVDARADVWALAVTLHELLTDNLPFSGSGPALIAAIAADPPRTTHDHGVIVPPALDQLIARCLSKSPERRPEDATALGRELMRFASAEKRRLLHTWLGTAPVPVGRWKRLLRPAGAATLLLGLCATALVLAAPSPPAPSSGPPAETNRAPEASPPTAPPPLESDAPAPQSESSASAPSAAASSVRAAPRLHTAPRATLRTSPVTTVSAPGRPPAPPTPTFLETREF